MNNNERSPGSLVGIESQLERASSDLSREMSGLQEDIGKVYPEKISEDDIGELRSRGNKLLTLIGGLSGMGMGTLGAAYTLMGNASTAPAIVTAILFTIGGGLKLLALERERRK